MSVNNKSKDVGPDNEYKKLMKVDYTYPDPSDPDFQYKIYKKREFYYHKISERPNMDEYADIKEYRENVCARQFTLHEHQAMLSNFINPNTPYKGILIFHGLGTGKCKRAEDYDYVNGVLIRANDIWTRYSNGNILLDNENGEWSIPNENLYVNSIDNYGKIVKKKVSKLYRERIKSQIRVIEFENGCKIGITYQHKLLTIDGWKKQFNIDDYIATPKFLYNMNVEFDNNMAYILGYYLNMGDVEEDNIIIIVSKSSNLIKIMNKLETLKIEYYYKMIDYDKYKFYLKNIKKTFDNMDDYWTAQIPNFIMNADKRAIKSYLKGIYDSQQIVSQTNKNIYLTTYQRNKKITKQIYVLAKILGIDIRIEKIFDKIKYYNIIIDHNDINIINEINSDNRNISYKLDEEIKDTINLARKMNIQLDNIFDDCSRFTSQMIVMLIDKLEQVQISLNDKLLHSKIIYLKNILSNEIIYTKIISIKEKYYDDYVYDLEISDYHNYVSEGILCHNTCAAISIAENFKEVVQKYNTKIYVLVSGPLIRENWKNELLTCTGETYLKYQDKNIYIDEMEKQKLEKNAISNALQYYRFMSYRSFYKRVLGEKIVDRKTVEGEKVKVTYRRNEDGDFERDIAVDRIYNLNNSLIIVDEAHNLTGNAYGEALKTIINNSVNLKLVLLSATPMKNLADDIIELLNFLRPTDSQIERDRVFTNDKIHLLDYKPGGLDYLKQMAQGYVSHVRGADPLIFATRVDEGVTPEGLESIKVIRCKMLPFQKKIYQQAVELVHEDSLDRKSEAVANFAFPVLSVDKKSIIGVYGREGISTVKNQLKSNSELLNKKIGELLGKESNNFIDVTDDGKTITGDIFKLDNLKQFSIKFYTSLLKIRKLVWGKSGPQTAFVYSNLVKVGIELFQQVLNQNGYMEYQENYSNYQIKSDSVCYFCGESYYDHSNHKLNKEIPSHKFAPSTYIVVTGKANDEAAELIPEDKQRILKNVFSNIDNKDGRYIKLVLGSKVMNEGISLRNVGKVHILDVYFNLGKVDQTVGRAIRQCSHFKLMNENNIFPQVSVYKYVVSLDNGLSTEEELYKKAEQKYALIKKTERALKEIAIDCPLNVHGNMFREEIEKYKDCGEKGKELCPVICDYTKCNYKCDNYKLNNEYYDPNRMIYKNVNKNDLDYSTFTNSLARNEIDHSKKKIKELYIKKYVYNIHNITDYVKNSYVNEKKELFDEFFVYKALDELVPISENDFNNFKDTILDKFNRPGYLIYRGKYYIFQPFDQNEDVPMYYRSFFNKNISQNLSLYNYIKTNPKYLSMKSTKSTSVSDIDININNDYNFDDVMEYYDSREEFDYVGIIDKEVSRRKNKRPDELDDVFKIREKRAKILDKKRGTGIPSLKGAVCSTSKNKEYLESIAKKLKVDIDPNDTRELICRAIKHKMLELEKYSTGKNKMTYIMIPSNHSDYPFPYNLEDRVEFIIDQIKNKIKLKLNINIKDSTYNGHPIYQIIIDNNNNVKDMADVMKSFDAQKKNNSWIITIK